MSGDELREHLRHELVHAVLKASSSIGRGIDRDVVIEWYDEGIIELALHLRDGEPRHLARASVMLAKIRAESGGY